MTAHAKTGHFLAYSPGGQYLGVASGVDTIRLRDMDAPRAARRICRAARGPTRRRWAEHLGGVPYERPCK